MLFQLKITLQDIEPSVWRRLLVPPDITLHDLHHVIQVALGWEDYHLHDFTIARTRYAVPSREDWDRPIDERTVCLQDVAKPKSTFVYQYDFGDSWYHDILIEKTTDDVKSAPHCLDGARACPPEDSGGPWGYSEKLDVLSDPSHEEYEEVREWMGSTFDPEQFDIDSINARLQRFGQKAPNSKDKRTRGS